MKIITKTTLRVGKGAEAKYLPPGEHEVGADLGAWLVKRGKAEAVGKGGKAEGAGKDAGGKAEGEADKA